MDELSEFTAKLIKTIPNAETGLTVAQAQFVVKHINEFLYTNYDGIGKTIALDTEYNYFSEFHKYWSEHYKEILDIKINNSQCEKIADVLHTIWKKSNGSVFSEIYDTCNLSSEEICRIRLLSANQDFRGSRKFSELAEVFISDNTVFDEKSIYENPERFLKNIQITDLSQTDKRINYAKNISKLLLERDITPYQLAEHCDNDLLKVKKLLIEYPSAGYGNKKADMFIRDMVILNVWKEAANFDKIDVASDVNTIKVALRTGIIKSAIPLVSSFIDIFCYQYAYVDEMNAKAWRKVWEFWKEKYPTETISSPCLIDYFIYNVVGKQFCKESLIIYQCESEEHCFKWHSPRNKTCQICYKNGIRNVKAHKIAQRLPCTDEEGYIAIQKTDFVRNNKIFSDLTECPFKSICIDNNCMMLSPPKSISIRGKTGWESAYTDRSNGGGGLMS